MIENLQAKLKDLFKDYANYDHIAVDDDVVDFENLIIDYDNEHSTDYYDQFVEQLNIYDLDTIKDMFINSSDTVFDIVDCVCDVDDQDKSYYKVDCYNCLSNVYISDLIDFVNDYIK